MQPPNLFTYAPNELSQDAMLMWLAAWAKEEYKDLDPALHNLGRSFITALIHKKYPEASPQFEHIKITPQWKKFDVLIEVDSQWVILIEDKTGSKEHNGQLDRYKELIEKHFGNWKQVLIYLKSGNESRIYRLAAEAKGFSVVYRSELLTWLPPIDDIHNDILRDFVNHLTLLEERTQSWQNSKDFPTDWKAAEGLLMAIEERLHDRLTTERTVDMEWNYVPNMQGGFLGLWYGFTPTRPKVYLQLEYSTPAGIGKLDLTIRVSISPDEDYEKLNSVILTIAQGAQKEGIVLERSKRPSRSASSARIARLQISPAPDGQVNLLLYIDEWLERVERILDQLQGEIGVI